MVIGLALFAAFIGAVGFMIDGWLVSGRNHKAVSPAERLTLSAYINVLILIVILALVPGQAWLDINWYSLGLLLGIGVLDAAYNILYLKALQTSSASLVNPLVSISPLITLLVSTFFLSAYNPGIIFLIVVLFVLGVYVIQFNIANGLHWKKLLLPFHTPIAKLALSSAVCTGIAAVLMDVTLDHHYTSPIVLLVVRMSLIGMFTHLVFRPHLFPAQYKKSLWLFILLVTEFIYAIERIALTSAINLGNVALVSAIFSITPLFVLLFDVLFMKQKLTVSKLIGTILIMLGIILAVTL